METMDSSGLSYLDASRVDSPAGDLSAFSLEDNCGHTIGRVDGVVIDAAQWRVRFFVVAPEGGERRRYLLPTEMAALQVDHERNALKTQTAAEDLVRCAQFRTAPVRDYSDEDLLAALFPKRIA